LKKTAEMHGKRGSKRFFALAGMLPAGGQNEPLLTLKNKGAMGFQQITKRILN
jgi:hypothetical protein